ncbi:hypothetical protein BU14_0125s0020 [Porphyra umbilicalis]|uniref:Uncharacterized protein n=1 Tax=Porphyra umbilicalis TaxID=2786 RepID=A0A1X6PAY2_PORUM|nr:hypothetical protein BU14_0125s0020 [Porphyra umbilicalis]|eukprot:OSX78032.1 hypothetical protein BU14_0125s0020 [Porphyra umbilicalis]
MSSSESDGPRVDGGNAHHHRKHRVPRYLTDHVFKRQEAAALLAVWSALVLTEGTVRFILTSPGQDLFPADRPVNVLPPFLPFLAALAECVFGLTGLLVGVGAAFFNAHSRLVTIAFLGSQTVLSWFVFIIYVFLIPSYRARYLTESVFPFDTLGESRAFLTMGILTSVTLCLALQGGQFAFGVRLLAHQSPPGKASAAHAAKAAARGVFWNGNMVFGGVSTAVAGLLLLSNTAGRGGAGRLDGVFAAPPHVGVFPVLTLLTGLSMVATGLSGMAACVAHKLLKPFLAMTVANYLLMYLNFTIVQVGAIRPTGPPQAGAFHSGLVLLTALIGPYFTYRARLSRHEPHTDGSEGAAA